MEQKEEILHICVCDTFMVNREDFPALLPISAENTISYAGAPSAGYGFYIASTPTRGPSLFSIGSYNQSAFVS